LAVAACGRAEQTGGKEPQRRRFANNWPILTYLPEDPELMVGCGQFLLLRRLPRAPETTPYHSPAHAGQSRPKFEVADWFPAIHSRRVPGRLFKRAAAFGKMRRLCGVRCGQPRRRCFPWQS
jgi:hypothetical protein